MNDEHYKSMRMKILASMIIVPIFPFILASIVTFYHFTESIETNTVFRMKRIVEDHRQVIELFLKERKADLQFVADSYSYNDLNTSDALQRIFDNLQNKSNAFVDLGVFDETGLHVAYFGPYRLAGKKYGETEWFKEVMRKGYYVSDIFLGYRKVPHFVIAIAKRENGRFWVIRATIDTLLFNDLVEKVRLGKTGEAYILNKDGIFQTKRRSGGELMKKDSDAAKYLALHSGLKTFVQKDISGESYFYVTTWLKDDNWLLVVRQEKRDAFASLHSASWLVLLITALGIFAIAIIAFVFSSRVIRRMELVDQEKGQLGQQLIVAGRLAEIGEMSAGFAHEINHPLQIIRAEQTLMEMIISELIDRGDLKESEDLEEFTESLEQIKTQVDRCAEITQGLLKFARQKDTVPRDLDLRDFVPEVIRMVEKKAEVEGITIKQGIPDNIPVINADAPQLQQVLLNFLNNAVFAVQEKYDSTGGGEITVGLSSRDNQVDITVTDNGSGISSENLKKIFTPFFSTKPVGQGTGLGLSICYGIIEKMGGVIEVSSTEGKGTTFTIRLPINV